MNIQFHELKLNLEDKTYARLRKVAKAKGMKVDECAKMLLIDAIYGSLTQMRRQQMRKEALGGYGGEDDDS
ncbi:MAG: hypothetical protein ACLTS9_11585 [Sutterella wadsworthensis]